MKTYGRPALIRRIRNSLTAIPDGYVTVPLIELGTPVNQAKAQLAEVGLDSTSPDVDFPDYATGTDPVTGSVVAEGSTVALTIGDG